VLYGTDKYRRKGYLMTMMDSGPETMGPTLRERILGAAFEAFVAQGYAGTSTLEVARRARVSKRDLYAQFGSKQAMLAACITARVTRMRRPLDLPVVSNLAALHATLLALGETLLREVSRPEVLAAYRLAILEAERAPEVAQTLDALGREGNRAALIGLLRGAQAAHLLRPGDVVEMADTFLALLWTGGLLTRLLLRVAAAPDDSEVAARARFAADHLMRCHGEPPTV
jgi:AcrR family transcriptional regulator